LTSEDAVVVDAFKQAEDKDGWILRCYDHIGADRQFELTYTGEGQILWQETDMMEIPLEALQSGSLVLHLTPYEVKTIKIKVVDHAN